MKKLVIKLTVATFLLAGLVGISSVTKGDAQQADPGDTKPGGPGIVDGTL